MNYFLNDVVEFGRKVSIKTAPKGYFRWKAPVKSGIYKNGLLGDVLTETKSGNLNVTRRGTNILKISDSRGIVLTKPRSDISGVPIDFLENKVKQKRRVYLRNPKKPNDVIDTPPTEQTTTSTRLLNKYTLGGAGLLGAGTLLYGGYKLTKRDKR